MLDEVNNQNKRIVEEKFQKFRAAHLQISNKGVLSSLDINSIETEKRIELNREDEGYENILNSIPNNEKIMDIMLADPKIFELSEVLRREADQKNRAMLVATFPQRYKNLLQSEAKFKLGQRLINEKEERHRKEVETLKYKKQQLEIRVKQLQKIVNKNEEVERHANQSRYQCIKEQIRKKDLQAADMKNYIDTLEKKNNKLREDYKNSNNIIIELREQEENYQKQARRLVEKLKQTQQKLIKAHKKLLEYDSQKKLEINSIRTEFEDRLAEMIEKNNYTEQLLEQANVRVQYKESLLQMSQKQAEQTIQKLQEQVSQKHQQIQLLREEHLQALKTIDELEERVNMQEEQIVREANIWNIEKEEQRRQIQKSHQLSGELKVQLQVKSQLIRMLEKSIQCLKKSFESQLSTKTTEQVQQNGVLSKFRSQAENYLKQIHDMEQQKKKLSDLLSDTEKSLILYFEKIIEQEQQCCQLRFKIEQYIAENISGNKIIDHQGILKEDWECQINELKKQCQQKNKKISIYQGIVQKMKNQIVQLTNSSRQNSTKNGRIFKQLIEENKNLKLLVKVQDSQKINLFCFKQQ